jgi:two-component system chemotaxis response regulator CheB
LSTDELINNSRPAIDILLQTAAYTYRNKLIGILLSGANKDGALGMQKIAERGGLTIIQNPADCLIDTMPSSALKITAIDHILNTDEIIDFLLELDKYTKMNKITEL